MNVTEGTNISGSSCGDQGIESGIERWDLVGSRLENFTHYVYGNAPTVSQGDFHLVGPHIEIVTQGRLDQRFGFVKCNAFYVDTSQLTQLNSASGIYFGHCVVIAHTKNGDTQFITHSQFVIGGGFGIQAALINFQIPIAEEFLSVNGHRFVGLARHNFRSCDGSGCFNNGLFAFGIRGFFDRGTWRGRSDRCIRLNLIETVFEGLRFGGGQPFGHGQFFGLFNAQTRCLSLIEKIQNLCICKISCFQRCRILR